MSQIQSSLTSADEHYASSFSFDGGHLALPPAKKTAGASARDAIRSIVVSEQLLGTREIVLVKHTGCGMLTFSNEDARGLVEKNLGKAATQELADLDFLPFQELDAAIKEDVTYLKQSKLVPDDVVISGWIYEVETGKVRDVI
ncbi:hypothetical protein MBLNU459_g1910t2 [Dothideomycetes sp. NU459]